MKHLTPAWAYGKRVVEIKNKNTILVIETIVLFVESSIIVVNLSFFWKTWSSVSPRGTVSYTEMQHNM